MKICCVEKHLCLFNVRNSNPAEAQHQGSALKALVQAFIWGDKA